MKRYSGFAEPIQGVSDYAFNTCAKFYCRLWSNVQLTEVPGDPCFACFQLSFAAIDIAACCTPPIFLIPGVTLLVLTPVATFSHSQGALLHSAFRFAAEATPDRVILQGITLYPLLLNAPSGTPSCGGF